MKQMEKMLMKMNFKTALQRRRIQYEDDISFIVCISHNDKDSPLCLCYQLSSFILVAHVLPIRIREHLTDELDHA